MRKNTYKHATYRITFSCGCTESVRVGGYTEEYRSEKAESMKDDICPKCYEKLKEERRKDAVKGLELAKLKGSGRQIEWAKYIRVTMLCNLSKQADKELIAKQTSAVFFIDNRDKDVYSVIENLQKANEEIEENNEETYTLVELEGSENQIAWAETIRKEAIADCDNKELEIIIASEKSAKFIIENRSRDGRSLAYDILTKSILENIDVTNCLEDEASFKDLKADATEEGFELDEEMLEEIKAIEDKRRLMILAVEKISIAVNDKQLIKDILNFLKFKASLKFLYDFRIHDLELLEENAR